MAACVDASSGGTSFGSGGAGPSEDTGGSEGRSEGADTANTTPAGEADGANLFDVGAFDIGVGGTPGGCTVLADGNAPPPCDARAPADSFEPVVEWSWIGFPEQVSVITPLVANLTDDDGNGVIDLCDVPDIVVVGKGMNANYAWPGHLHLLDGRGEGELTIATAVDPTVTPALGDIDGDGVVEIVTALPPDTPTSELGDAMSGPLVAFAPDGTVEWTGDTPWVRGFGGALALADVDNDGDVEIIAGEMLVDHTGHTLWSTPEPEGVVPVPTAADLDGDGDLELVLGARAYHHDGTLYFDNADVGAPGTPPTAPTRLPQVANLDDDPEPEVLVTTHNGVSVLEHDGTTKFANLRPTGDPITHGAWARPVVIHDFDGDGDSDFALASTQHFTTYRADATILWSSDIADVSGLSGGTAFDFLGDGQAEAIYGDESSIFVFDETGIVRFEVLRSSSTLIEYPVVADVDNDGSAEIVVVTEYGIGLTPTAPALQVIGDADDRWIQARRIWNQHTYHVTNVREDGSIPQFEPPSWQQLNTFRSNAQIEGGTACDPVPAG